jgi:hypothetical protein
MKQKSFWAGAGKALTASTAMLIIFLVLSPSAGASESKVMNTFSGGDGQQPRAVDPWVQLAKLTASGGNGLGFVAISGNTIVAVGGSAAYVFVKPATGWADMTETAILTASDGVAFGRVAVNGNTVVATGGGEAAYVFVESANGWTNMTETAKLTASDYPVCYYFGRDSGAAISGNTVVVGCNAAGGLSQGAGYVFVRPKSGWTNMTETAKLTSSDNSVFGNVGLSVAISSDTIVLGAPYLSFPNLYQGAAYLFVRPASGWTDMTESAKLTPSDGTPYECFAGSTAIIGDTVLAGVYEGQGCATGPASAYIFVKPPSGWTNMTETATLGVRGGIRLYPVSMSTHVVIASEGNAAYLFYKPSNGWVKTSRPNAKISASGWVGVTEHPPTVVSAGGDAVYVFGRP